MTTTTETQTWTKPDLGYTYEFEPHDLAGIQACHDAHGFAIVKGLIDLDTVAELKASIDEVLNPNQDLKPAETRVGHGFVEFSPALRKLLDHEPFLNIQRHLLGSHEMTVHRSAAILKNVGTGVGAWHTDWSFYQGPPRNSGDVLNVREHPSGKWFYLEGTHPSRGGLAIIEDSHRMDWPGPEGFEFTADRKSFHRKGTPATAYTAMDVPGVVPLFTEPGDMILFAARTYHGVYPHHGTEPRHSIALGFRARGPWPVPWSLRDSAVRMLAELPERHRKFFEHYTSIEPGWRADAAPAPKDAMRM